MTSRIKISGVVVQKKKKLKRERLAETKWLEAVHFPIIPTALPIQPLVVPNMPSSPFYDHVMPAQHLQYKRNCENSVNFSRLSIQRTERTPRSQIQSDGRELTAVTNHTSQFTLLFVTRSTNLGCTILCSGCIRILWGCTG